jgi:hypothetical protein
VKRDNPMGRRDLLRWFGLGRREARTGFSLEEFYRRRAAQGVDRAPPPAITLRPGLDRAAVETTDIGVPELGPRPGRRRR